MDGVPSTEQADFTDTQTSFFQLLLKSRPLDAVDAQIQNVRHGVFRTVEADFWILRKLRAQQTIQRRNVCDALVLISSAKRSAFSIDIAMPSAGVPLR